MVRGWEVGERGEGSRGKGGGIGGKGEEVGNAYPLCIISATPMNNVNVLYHITLSSNLRHSCPPSNRKIESRSHSLHNLDD